MLSAFVCNTGRVLSQASLLTQMSSSRNNDSTGGCATKHNLSDMLMSHIIHVVMGKVTLPLITVPTGVAVIGANVPNPSKEDLRAARHNRFVNYLSLQEQSDIPHAALQARTGNRWLAHAGSTRRTFRLNLP